VRVRLIVNPVASSMTARRRALVESTLGAGHNVESVSTTHRGHAGELAREAVADGVDVVVVAGGDGTLTEAAIGMAGVWPVTS
jgi:diacylglycerol kinase family enzyme